MKSYHVDSGAGIAGLGRAIAVNRLKPVIDRVFSFEDAIAAFRYYEAGQFFGEVVIGHPCPGPMHIMLESNLEVMNVDDLLH